MKGSRKHFITHGRGVEPSWVSEIAVVSPERLRNGLKYIDL